MANRISDLSIYYQNARGLRTKTTTFYRNVCVNHYDIIIITESWLLSNIADAELVDSRYVMWRRDRDYARTRQTLGGGVCIAVRRYLNVTPQPTYQSSAEDIWITLIINKSIILHICAVYLCEQNCGYSYSEQLRNYLHTLNDIIMKNPNDRYVIVGDFNLSGVKWSLDSRSGPPLLPSEFRSPDEIRLIDELNLLGLGQYNGVLNAFNKTLDLVLSNEYIIVSDCRDDCLVPVDPYHGALSLCLRFGNLTPLLSKPRTSFLYEQGDYDSINTELGSLDWYNEILSRPLEDAIDYFYDTCYNLRDKYVPSKLIANDDYPKWYTKALKKAIREKHKYCRKFRIYGNLSDLESFKLLRDRVKKLESKCYSNYIALVEKSLNKNSKYFWSYVKSKSKSNSMPSSMNYTDRVYNTGDAICEAFSDYFRTSFLNSSSISPMVNQQVGNPYVAGLPSICVNCEEVTKLLKGLDPSKSSGPDNLPARFLINCAVTISIPITLLFKKSLACGSVPKIWKRAYITPIHKKGPRTNIDNYRPISKLCIISKVFEKLVYKEVYNHIKLGLSSSQHGFLKGRSTVTNLVTFNNYLTERMDNGCQVDVIYTDYSKAFDRIQHSKLIHKLSTIGICGDLLRWFASYIDNRSQAVVVNNYISSWVSISSGVPQGSLLGPLLFTIFVNDIDICFQNSKLLCYADDMKIISVISSLNDALKLQADLTRLEEYCIANCLDLNPSKCSVLSYNRKRTLIKFDYSLAGVSLKRDIEMRDLGVVHDVKLKFDSHVDNILAKASKALGFVMRNSRDFTQENTLKTLYCALVRSNLEYASQIWSPRYATYITRIERIQRKFIRYMCFRSRKLYRSVDYQSVCKEYNLLTLNDRRIVADISFLLKIASGAIDSPELLSLISLRTTRCVRFNALIYLPKCNTFYRQNTFIWRASSKYNELCKYVDLDLFNTSTAAAKRMLSQYLFSNY